jgi:hypothetical protein
MLSKTYLRMVQVYKFCRLKYHQNSGPQTCQEQDLSSYDGVVQFLYHMWQSMTPSLTISSNPHEL